MYKIPANTLFVGKNLVFVPECHSTNTLAMELSQRGSAAEGAIIITDNQYSGRGQRGNQWISEPGMNLTFSLILKPTFLKPDQQFRLTMVISLAVADYVKSTITDLVRIKWPNDILVGDRKICGILIENSLSGDTIQFAVVGIGLNVNQGLFSTPNSTSLLVETHHDFDLNAELSLILEAVEARYLQLREGKNSLLTDDYLNSLYRKGEWHLFNTTQTTFEGMIEGIDTRGRLAIRTANAIQHYDLKEISFADKIG